MQKAIAIISRVVAPACLIAMISGAAAVPLSPEDRYIATRDAAIAKITKLHDSKKSDDAAKVEESVSADLLTQMKAILVEHDRKGFGPAKLNMDTFSKGHEGFGALDGLRFAAELGINGEKVGLKTHDGFVEPRAIIIVTTPTLFERWLRTHKDWWGKNGKNVPQEMAAAFKDESFYTQAIQTDSAVVNFNSLPIARPASATLLYAMLGARTQDATPSAADEVFVSALTNGKVYITYGSIKPEVRVPACIAIKANYDKKADKAADDLLSNRIDRKAYDKLGDLRQQGDDAYKKCFVQRAPQEPSFAEATRQAQALLAAAMGK